MKKTTVATKVVVDCDTAVHMLQASLERMTGFANRISSALYATGLLPELPGKESGPSDVRNMLQTTQQIVEDLQGDIEFALDYARKATGKQCVAFLVPDAGSVAVESKISH